MNPALTIRLEKWAIWIGVVAIIVLLRHLFPIFFLTFVLAYIGNTAVDAMSKRSRYRKVNVAVVWLLFLAILAGVLLLIVPRMLDGARALARQYIASEATREPGAETFLQREAREAVDSVVLGIAGPAAAREFKESPAYATILQKIETSLAEGSRRVTAGVTEFANAALAFALHFVLSIILSFILIWDLPRTRERLKRYAEGRTAEIYREVTPGAVAFGTMLGRSFEAQSIVALVNAVLSVVLFLALGLPSIALLAMIVFACSYIPILGMIISTIPAALLALKVGGISLVLWLIVGILVIHAVEAYMLNPLIYGRHLKLHPLVVLVILMVAEHLFGVWGLLLGVPVAAFVVKYVIEGDPMTPGSAEARAASTT